jgi:hypothetical protein
MRQLSPGSVPRHRGSPEDRCLSCQAMVSLHARQRQGIQPEFARRCEPRWRDHPDRPPLCNRQRGLEAVLPGESS